MQPRSARGRPAAAVADTAAAAVATGVAAATAAAVDATAAVATVVAAVVAAASGAASRREAGGTSAPRNADCRTVTYPSVGAGFSRPGGLRARDRKSVV